MTENAVLFVDTKKLLGDKQLAATKVFDIALVKRIVVDLRRSEIKNIFVVMDEFDERIEAILDDTRAVFHRRRFDDNLWREELSNLKTDSTFVLTADRLSDYRIFETMAEMSARTEEVSIAVDRKPFEKVTANEKSFAEFDGKPISSGEAKDATDTGIYIFPRRAVVDFERFDIEYISEKAKAFANKEKVNYFDIGNGFVQIVDSRETVRIAEQRITRFIWKATDEHHARLNKRILLPLIKVLLRTPLTPNMVSVVAVIISLSSGYFYSKGFYTATLIGAILAYISALADHVDGCIARLKAKESAFGAHFDTICDYIFYISFGVGMTIGLYKMSHNPVYIGLGIAAVCGILISLIIISYQRRASGNASDFAAQAHKKLSNHSQNPIIRYGKKSYFVVRRPIMPYYLMLFTLLHLLPFILFMVALSANLFWMFHIYTYKLYRPEPKV